MNDAEIARRSGLPERVIYAIRQVESGGRSPHAIRFEPHLFLHKRPDLRDRVPYVDSDGAGPLHTDRVRADTDRAALIRAMALDEDAAIRSASFGAYQTLGGILLSVTGLPPRAALAAFDSAPDGLGGELLLRWIKLNPRVRAPALATPEPDFRGIAAAYNGQGANVGHYADRLAAAWAAFPG